MGIDGTVRHPVQRARAREEHIIALLLAGRSVGEICEEVRISRSTLWRLRRSAEFQQRLQEARQNAFDAAVNRLHDSALVFVETLCQVCQDPKARDSAKATAARSGLDSLLNAKQFVEVEARLQRMEQLLASEVRK